MSSEKKAVELQVAVRQNAQEYQSSVKDLYLWEKEIKRKELAMKNAPAPTIETNNVPVRSHMQKSEAIVKTKAAKSDEDSRGVSAVSTPTEKQDLPVDALAQKHKKANDIKDRGNNYVKLTDYEKAIEAYTEAIEVYPQDPIYFINRALCYLKLERHDNCVQDCDAAIALDKLCVKAYYRRMQANESLGNNMEALKDCATVLAINPDNFEAKRSLERINIRLRKIATKNGPNFRSPCGDFIDILPFDKPAYKRSKQSMRRVPVVDIITPRPDKDDLKELRISDEEIDKIFNTSCGPFEELKRGKSQYNVTELITKEKVNFRIEETKQPITQPKFIEETSEYLKNSVETTSSHNTKATDYHNNNIFVEKTVTAASETPKNHNEPVKSIKCVDNSDKSEDPSIKKINKINKSPMEFVPAAPSGTAQFYMTWKELSPNQKYIYLKSIEISNLCKVLGAGFGSDTFTELLRTLKDFYVPNKEPTTAAVLLEISKNDEFSILSMFMSPEERKMVAFILDEIKKFPKFNAGLLEKLGKAFNVA